MVRIDSERGMECLHGLRPLVDVAQRMTKAKMRVRELRAKLDRTPERSDR